MFEHLDLSALDDTAQDQAARTAITAAQTGFDIRTGPAVPSLLLTQGGAHAPRLFLAAHHYVVRPRSPGG
ncbi:hypothetical protein [Streptacidiphilus sp. P02-A3a]|uniref:hypothetical protein n=1 Tax=Streptacidiphilus sp. P02-A3a TaxID=2704468 RepID=UPI001CDC705E|nr:hypothetical protein [Streptacidiphilus sp. P02-A3a]